MKTTKKIRMERNSKRDGGWELFKFKTVEADSGTISFWARIDIYHPKLMILLFDQIIDSMFSSLLDHWNPVS